MLNLEVVGKVREIAEGEAVPRQKAQAPLKRLRDSHHAVARLMAAGLSHTQISLQTGYGINRLSILQDDPSFQELLAFYRQDRAAVAAEVEQKFLLVAEDARQILHERLLDAPEEVSTEEALNIFKTMADRAGYAPVQRSVNKNLNLNIGERLDAARRRRTIDAE